MKSISWLLLAGLAACQSPASETVTTTAAVSSASTPPNPVGAQAPAAFLFDVPVLLNQSLSQIEQKLGKPSSPDTPNASADELERTYAKQGQKLVITYNTKTKHPESFFLPAPGPSETTKNCNKLLIAGHLQAGSPAYTIDSLASDEANDYLGIVVTRK